MMNKRSAFGTVAGSALLLLGSMGLGLADDDEHEGKGAAGSGAMPSIYAQECGACHVAYPAGLLPAANWRHLMGGLADHFGDDASLDDAQTVAAIEAYLLDHGGRRWGVDGSVLRISRTRWFVRKHDGLSERMVKGNPKVRSFSNCDACHADAAKGDFEEDRVRVPGYGRWEDD